MNKLVLMLALIALGAFGLVACGDDEDETTTGAETTQTETATTSDGGGGGGTVSISADPDGALAYTETEVSAPAGDVTIEFENQSSIPHDVVVEDDGGNELARTDVITGDTTSTDATLDAGDYTFYCSVDGHRAAGMEGTLTAE